MQLPLKPISQEHKMTWVFWITLPILSITMLISLVLGMQKEGSHWSDLSFEDLINPALPALIVVPLFCFLLFIMKLTWTLNDNGFYYRYRPFIMKTRFLPADDIESVTLEKINPLRDFGGWGLRYSRKYGKAYTTQGNHVLRIRLKSGAIINVTADPNTDLSA
jgi:hypothetical protein